MKEFEDKKVELKENLIAELEEKKKMIENEKLTMELTGGTKAPLSRVLSPEGLQVLLLSCFRLCSSAEQSNLKEGGFDRTGQFSPFLGLAVGLK